MSYFFPFPVVHYTLSVVEVARYNAGEVEGHECHG